MTENATNLRAEVFAFLGVKESAELHTFNESFPAFHAVDLLRALRDELPRRGFTVDVKSLAGVRPRPGKIDGQAKLEDVIQCDRLVGWGWNADRDEEVAPDRLEAFPTAALYFLREGARSMVLEIGSRWMQSGITGAVRHAAEAVAWTRGVMRELRDWVRAHSKYRGHVVRPGIIGRDVGCRGGVEQFVGELGYVRGVASAGVYLPPEMVDELERYFLHFRLHRNVLSAGGFEARRGLMLYGEPGTGKSSTCRYLKSRLPDHTFFLLDARHHAHLESVFKLAGHFAPSVVVIEDVDLIARSREGQHQAWVLGDLLNVLDGIEDRADVSLVVTSNSWKFLERALVDRPGRIDHVIQVAAPDAEQRLRLLGAFARGVALPGEPAALVERTQGLLPAQLQELVRRAVVRGVAREGDAWARRVAQVDFDEALASLRRRPTMNEGRRIAM